MTEQAWLWPIVALLAVNMLMLLWIAFRGPDEEPLDRLADQLRQALRADVELSDRTLRSDLQETSRAARQELAGALSLFQQTLLHQGIDVARAQNEQIDSIHTQLASMQQMLAQGLQATTNTLAQQSRAARDSQETTLARMSEQQLNAAQRLADHLLGLSQAHERRLGEMRAAVEQRLDALQAANEHKLEQMRATVDERLHATLEARLGESFKQVAERLEQVHRGLGEMQTLARDVGALNRVLGNVKTRGIFGEVQLAGLLEQVFTPDQYAANVETVPGSNSRVEFAIRLPGPGEGAAPLWLPIDAKFPREDYERLLDAQERADPKAAEVATRAIESRLRFEARAIHEKYIAAPHTTDFGILFLPTEGLYAEALRRPGLVQALQRDWRVTVAGPTTLLATLSSLQMGFRTLALERRSAEVWEVLGAVKTEFQKFGDVLARTKKKLDEASSSIDLAERRTRVMARELRSVEALPEGRTQQLLSGPGDDGLLDFAAPVRPGHAP